MLVICIVGVMMIVVVKLYHRAQWKALANYRKQAVQQAADRAASEVRRQKELMAVSLDSIGEGVIMSDVQGRIILINSEAERLTGWKEQDACGQRLAGQFEIVHESTRQPLESPFDKVLQAGVRIQLEQPAVLVSGDRREIPIDGAAAPVRDESGAVQGVVLVFHDCTHRRQSEKLRVQLAAIIESTHDAVFSEDLDGIIQTWNRAAVRLFGYETAEAVGKPRTSLVPSDRIEEKIDVLSRFQDGRHVEYLDTVRRTKDGRQINVSVTASPLIDQNGRITGTSMIIRDITDRKRVERELQASRADLASRAEQLARSNSYLEQFAYAASHDLKEPLRMVSSFTKLLAEEYAGRLDSDADKYIHYAVDGATRMQTLIDDILNFSRVGNADEDRSEVDLQAVMDHVLLNLEQAVQESGAAVEVGSLPKVVGHPSGLTQLLQNLVSNAVKFRGPDVPRIQVSSIAHDRAYEILVKDNGIGIAAESHERIFRMFQRLHTKTEYPGTGIGLAICKKIVDHHGGKIWIESQPGKGTCFHVTLPKQQA